MTKTIYTMTTKASLLLLVFLTTALSAQTTITWDGSESTAWDEPLNWDLNRVPNANDMVSISSVSAQPILGAGLSTTIQALSLNSNHLEVAASATLNVVGADDDAILNNTGILTVNGTLNISGHLGDGIYLDDGTLVIAGELVIEGGEQGILASGTLTFSGGDTEIVNTMSHGIKLEDGVTMTVAEDATLTIEEPGGDGILVAQNSALTCAGVIDIVDALGDGIDQRNGQLTVATTGEIQIENSLQYGINGASFVNDGRLESSASGLDGIAIRAECTNNGLLQVDDASANGIVIADGRELLNSGTVDVGSSSNYEVIGGTFKNLANGILSSIGLLSAGNLDFAAGSILDIASSSSTLTLDNSTDVTGAVIQFQIRRVRGVLLSNQLALSAGDLVLTDAVLSLDASGYQFASDDVFTLIDLPLGSSITGVFAGLPEGSTLFLDGEPFAITYQGGDGNDVVLSYNPAALPVELQTFTGTNVAKANKLYWTTAREENFSHFVVERSQAGAWISLGSITGGSGSTSLPGQSYTFMDEQPLPAAYYRLKMVDFDGSYSCSEVLYLAHDLGAAAGAMQVFPNPSTGPFTLVLPNTEVTTLRLYSTAGQELWSKSLSDASPSEAEATTLSLPQLELPAGTYLLVATAANGRRWTERLVIR